MSLGIFILNAIMLLANVAFAIGGVITGEISPWINLCGWLIACAWFALCAAES